MDNPITPPPVPEMPAPARTEWGRWELLPEDIPNIDDLVIDDGAPMDSIFAEKQARLLTDPLYSSWPGPDGGQPFLALADVGLFHTVGEPPLVPDVALSVGVQVAADLARKENRSYFLWIMGKPPSVVIEFVSDRRGGEAGHKMREYARIGVPYYVIFDPEKRLGPDVLRAFGLHEGSYRPIDPAWLPEVGLGLKMWEGTFEGHANYWLRWCDRNGVVIPTGRERAEQERQRAEQERQRAERLEARLRELGHDPGA